VLGQPWSFQGEIEIQPAQSTSQTLFQRYPEIFIGAVAALILIWAVSALRRRGASD
jgi:hypothetical protein